jgi:hypothetical protein
MADILALMEQEEKLATGFYPDLMHTLQRSGYQGEGVKVKPQASPKEVKIEYRVPLAEEVAAWLGMQ